MDRIERIMARWDAKAAPQLREEIERLRIELEATKRQLEAERGRTEHWMAVADEWREDFFNQIESDGMQPAIDMQGRIFAIEKKEESK